MSVATAALEAHLDGTDPEMAQGLTVAVNAQNSVVYCAVGSDAQKIMCIVGDSIGDSAAQCFADRMTDAVHGHGMPREWTARRPSLPPPRSPSLMEQAGAFADRMQNADFMCIAARPRGDRVTRQPARPRQFRQSGQTPPPANAKISRRHALRPFPGPSPSLLGPDASSPARTTSAAGVAWQRVNL